MSGPLWVRSGTSWCKQDRAAPKEMFQILAAGWRSRSLFILQTAITKAELHPVTSFSRLGRRECLHRAVKTQRCERLALRHPGRPLPLGRAPLLPQHQPGDFMGEEACSVCMGWLRLPSRLHCIFPWLQHNSEAVFLWEGNKLLHHCDLCAVSC